MGLGGLSLRNEVASAELSMLIVSNRRDAQEAGDEMERGEVCWFSCKSYWDGVHFPSRLADPGGIAMFVGISFRDSFPREVERHWDSAVGTCMKIITR